MFRLECECGRILRITEIYYGEYPFWVCGTMHTCSLRAYLTTDLRVMQSSQYHEISWDFNSLANQGLAGLDVLATSDFAKFYFHFTKLTSNFCNMISWWFFIILQISLSTACIFYKWTRERMKKELFIWLRWQEPASNNPKPCTSVIVILTWYPAEANPQKIIYVGHIAITNHTDGLHKKAKLDKKNWSCRLVTCSRWRVIARDGLTSLQATTNATISLTMSHS